VSVSALARETWKRLTHWYGADAMERKFRTLAPPPDWAKAIDGVGKERIALVLADVRTKYPSFLPNLPEFDAIAARHAPKSGARPDPPNMRLANHAIRHLPLTPKQFRGSWTYLRADNEIVGLVIAADGDAPGYRVMLSDLDAFA